MDGVALSQGVFVQPILEASNGTITEFSVGWINGCESGVTFLIGKKSNIHMPLCKPKLHVNLINYLIRSNCFYYCQSIWLPYFNNYWYNSRSIIYIFILGLCSGYPKYNISDNVLWRWTWSWTWTYLWAIHSACYIVL